MLTLAFVVRYLILASRPKVSDTPNFELALQLWAPIVHDERPTPRFLKRYKNRVRYFAMRMRPPPEDPHPAERLARWLFRHLRDRNAADPTASAADPEVREANIVALTALRVVDLSLVAAGQRTTADRLRALLELAEDKSEEVRLHAIEAALTEHESRFAPLEWDRRRFANVDPQDGEDATDGVDRSVEAPVKAA